MEGGSPSLIWERWTLPMYYTQLRYWGDHPRVDELVASYLGVKHRYTPPRDQKSAANIVNWDLLDPAKTPTRSGW